jgi:hypothetical protein
MRKALFASLVLALTAFNATAQVRKVAINDDGILTVKTALGIATIIQLPEIIQSAIIGDQSGFKIEYLDRAVTIKPLRWAAKTNLYLVTEKRRYNIRLQTQSQELADYIVYVRGPDANTPATKWVSMGKSSVQNELRLTVERVGHTFGGFILVDVNLAPTNNQLISIKPSEIWIKQNGTSKVINGLFLSSLKLEKKSPLRIGISLAKSDLIFGKPIVLEVRGKKEISVTISEDALWK